MSINNHFYRVMPGRKSVHIDDCLDGGFIGGDWGFTEDLSEAYPKIGGSLIRFVSQFS